MLKKKKKNNFLVSISNKILAIRVGVNKMLVRIANSEDPDQAASEEAVWSGFTPFV